MHSPARPAALAVAVLTVALIIACGDGGGVPGFLDPTPTPPSATQPAVVDPSPPSLVDAGSPTSEGERAPLEPLALQPVAPNVVFDRPVDAYTLDGNHIYVVEQEGVIYRLEGDESVLAADLREHVSYTGSEDGLLSVTPDPAFEANGQLWLYYFDDEPARTVLSRMTLDADGAFDLESEFVVLEVPQPYRNHNGGSIRFGPDGMLYLGIGDGGGPGGPHSQQRTDLLSTIVRLDVSEANEEEPYRIPDDNPFVDEPDALSEIWAYGLRNPWRMHFDPDTELLWVADVGENEVEEISIASAGANLGWRVMEGDRCYEPSVNCVLEGMTPPVAVYQHEHNRCSISGGPIARESSIPGLDGYYLFGDLCSEEIWVLDRSLEMSPILMLDQAGPVIAIEQLGSDLYVISFGKPLQRIVSADAS